MYSFHVSFVIQNNYFEIYLCCWCVSVVPSFFFLLLSSILLYEHAAILFIHAAVEGHVGCFLVWDFVNKATVNICVQVFLWIYLFSWVNT